MKHNNTIHKILSSGFLVILLCGVAACGGEPSDPSNDAFLEEDEVGGTPQARRILEGGGGLVPTCGNGDCEAGDPYWETQMSCPTDCPTPRNCEAEPPQDGVGHGTDPCHYPNGGGYGYPHLVDQATEADYSVSTVTELKRDLLAASASGGVVFVKSNIDLGAERNITIGANVTLAGDRGRCSSCVGPTLYTNVATVVDIGNSVFNVTGNDARITGLTLQGPWTSNTAPADEADKRLYGIKVNGAQRFRLDNARVYGFRGAGLSLYRCGTAKVWYNVIRRNLITSGNGGYGVVVSESCSAEIRGNYFNNNKHAIAGGGNPGCSYEAFFNKVERDGKQQDFDMHDNYYDNGNWPPGAGDLILIHHNTFYDGNSHPAIWIRGIPGDPNSAVHHNNFGPESGASIELGQVAYKSFCDGYLGDGAVWQTRGASGVLYPGPDGNLDNFSNRCRNSLGQSFWCSCPVPN